MYFEGKLIKKNFPVFSDSPIDDTDDDPTYIPEMPKRNPKDDTLVDYVLHRDQNEKRALKRKEKLSENKKKKAEVNAQIVARKIEPAKVPGNRPDWTADEVEVMLRVAVPNRELMKKKSKSAQKDHYYDLIESEYLCVHILGLISIYVEEFLVNCILIWFIAIYFISMKSYGHLSYQIVGENRTYLITGKFHGYFNYYLSVFLHIIVCYTCNYKDMQTAHISHIHQSSLL